MEGVTVLPKGDIGLQHSQTFVMKQRIKWLDNAANMMKKYILCKTTIFWLRYQGVSLKQRLFLSWSWNCLSCSHMISVPTNLRYLFFYCLERNWDRKLLHRINSLRAYLLSRKYVNMNWTLCSVLEGMFKVAKRETKIQNLRQMHIYLYVSTCTHQHQLVCMRAASEQKISVSTCETSRFTKWSRHTQPSDCLRTVIKKHATQNFFSFTSTV